MMTIYVDQQKIGVNPKCGLTSVRNTLAICDIKHKCFYISDRTDGDSVDLFIIRDPADRTVSMFTMLCKHIHLGSQKHAKAMQNIEDFTSRSILELTFSDFVSYLQNTPSPKRDIHHRDQYIPSSYRIAANTLQLPTALTHFLVQSGNTSSALTNEDLIKNLLKINNSATSRLSGAKGSSANSTILTINSRHTQPGFAFPDRSCFLSETIENAIRKLFPFEDKLCRQIG